MPHELPVNWSEIEKACIAGVPQRQVAKDIAAKTEGVSIDQLYKAIRKRASRERWPIPASIMRRARAEAMVATGAATSAKEGATWRKGESGRVQAGAMLATLGIEHSERGAAELLGCGGVDSVVAGVAESPNGAGVSGGGVDALGFGGGLVNGGGLTTSPPTATELVTADLVTLGQRGLRAILNRATQAAEAMTEAPEVRSWQDVQTMTKVISQAAGLDKPQVALSVSLNSGTNSGIAGWECAETIDTITERVG